MPLLSARNTDDRALVSALRAGQADALKSIYQKYKIDMLSVARAMVPDQATAEDIVHDVFVAFAGIAPTLRIRDNLKSYLLMSVANRIRTLARSGIPRAAGHDDPGRADSNASSPERLLSVAQTADRLRRALGAIPESQRDVVVLHHFEDLGFRSIAQASGESINTIQSRYRYGMDKLRDLLKEGNDHGLSRSEE